MWRKGFALSHIYAPKCACEPESVQCAYLRDADQNPLVRTLELSKDHTHQFEPKRLKLKLDIVEKPEDQCRDRKREYNRESPRMWEIIYIRANLRGRFS